MEIRISPRVAPESPRRSPWPVMIALGLLLVVVVNFLFIYIAVRGADPVVPSYRTEPR
jgi:hypothetical protein